MTDMQQPAISRMIDLILDKLHAMSPAYVRKVMLYTISLYNIEQERDG